MPCLEMTIPKQDTETKRRLAAALTDAFERATPFGREIFGIRFHEYESGETAVGGVLGTDRERGRPYLHFVLYCPRVSRKAKQAIVASFTTAYTDTIGDPLMKPIMHICEHPYDNVGVDGALLSDSYEACASSEFYYPVPKD